MQTVIDENQWKGLFPGIKELLNRSDYSIVNFESTIAETGDKPIEKIGSHIKTSYTSMFVVRQLGFKMITLANNHSMDYGDKALNQTLNEAKRLGIDHVGAGRDIREASMPAFIKIKNKTIGILNCCEHEFSIATNEKAGANPIDTIDTVQQIIDAKKHADFVLLIIHGGVEHYQLPTPRMKKLYRFFVDSGADAVINHHQHCYSGYETYKGKPIFYGIGNFCFDSSSDIQLRNKTYNYGYLVKLNLGEDGVITKEIFPYEQCFKVPGVYVYKDKRQFEKEIESLNHIISDDKLLEEAFEKMSYTKEKAYINFMRPYNSRIKKALNVRGLYPSKINREKKLFLLAKINCESHLEILKYNLNK